MYTIILLTHIFSMIASLALMASAVGLALFGVRSSVKLASLGMITTISGFLTGAILLLSSPLSFQCIVLTAYLAGTVALYRYGFGMGRVENARLVRGI